ncbi:hypothetical protein Tsubulata_009258 [Turnera subulata]|uniref:Uncharacterized protein n=1 Tax=Turnera subulata TaxID=218843 RepID=A0A9Q0JH32_9ROSI|nr:hypothetical protein Tsubulata_009258 [Turnera subulata]
MEREVTTTLRRSSLFSGCPMSPSCFPIREEMEYTRIHCCSGGRNHSKRSQRWRNFIRRLVRDSKSSIYGSKPLSFHYDAVSYLQNFDEGCHHEESHHCPKLFPVPEHVRWDLHE